MIFEDKPLSLSRPDEDSFRFASDLSGILYFSVKRKNNQSGRRNVIREIILFRNSLISVTCVVGRNFQIFPRSRGTLTKDEPFQKF